MSSLPPPPYVLSNVDFLAVWAEFDPDAVSRLLAEHGLKPAPNYTGGFSVFGDTHSKELGRFNGGQVWLDVAGFDSNDGSRARISVLATNSGKFHDVSRVIYHSPSEPGTGAIRSRDGEIEAVVRANSGWGFRLAARSLDRPPGWRTAMHFYVRPDSNGHVHLTHVGHSSEDFSAEPLNVEIDSPPGSVLDRLRPRRLMAAIRMRMHLTLGVPIPVDRSGPQAAEPDLIYLLSRLERGALLLDPDQGIVFANDKALDLVGHSLGRAPVASIERNAQTVAMPLLGNALREAVSQTNGDNRPVAFRRGADDRPVLLYAISLGPTDSAGRERRMQSSAIVLITDPRTAAPASAVPSLELLGLTPAEARAATLVGSGLAPKEAARMLGNTEATVRFQLRRAYDKLDITKQNELAAMVGRVARLGL